jgi:hypothetical protein
LCQRSWVTPREKLAQQVCFLGRVNYYDQHHQIQRSLFWTCRPLR